MQAPPSTTESTPSSRRQDPSLPLLHAPPSTVPIQVTSLASSMPTPQPLHFPPRRKRPSPPLREAATPPAPSSSSALSPKTPLQLVSPLTAVTEGKPTTSPWSPEGACLPPRREATSQDWPSLLWSQPTMWITASRARVARSSKWWSSSPIPALKSPIFTSWGPRSTEEKNPKLSTSRRNFSKWRRSQSCQRSYLPVQPFFRTHAV